MSAQPTKRLEVIAIKRLDTRALHRLRAEVETAQSTATAPPPPVVIGTRVASPPHAKRRLAMATFALGLFLGVLSSRLGESGSTALATPAPRASEPTTPPVVPAESAPAVVATNPVAASGAPTDAPKATATPPLAAKPVHHHHHSSASAAQITVEPSTTKGTANVADAEAAGK